MDNKGSLAILGKYEEAIIWYDKALALDPNDVVALNAKGAALFYLGKIQDALDSWNKTLTIDPTNQDALDAKSLLQG